MDVFSLVTFAATTAIPTLHQEDVLVALGETSVLEIQFVAAMRHVCFLRSVNAVMEAYFATMMKFAATATDAEPKIDVNVVLVEQSVQTTKFAAKKVVQKCAVIPLILVAFLRKRSLKSLLSVNQQLKG